MREAHVGERDDEIINEGINDDEAEQRERRQDVKVGQFVSAKIFFEVGKGHSALRLCCLLSYIVILEESSLVLGSNLVLRFVPSARDGSFRMTKRGGGTYATIVVKYSHRFLFTPIFGQLFSSGHFEHHGLKGWQIFWPKVTS
jgi:hypothetical protein